MVRYRLARVALAAVLSAALLPLSGCLFSRRHIKKFPNIPLKSAELPQLVNFINSEAHSIQTLNEKIDLTASVGGPKSGTITTFHDVTAYLLLKKPAYIRLIGTMSVVGKLFDMASNGTDFALYLPVQGKFFVGRNAIVPPNVKNPLERLRPQVIQEALLTNAIEAGQFAVAENDELDKYGIAIVGSVTGPCPPSPAPCTRMRLIRKIVFNRTNLLPQEQDIYDSNGNVVTVASYGSFRQVGDTMIPYVVTIQRPIEEYSIEIKVQRLKLNQPLTDTQFALQQPEGTQRVILSEMRRPEQSGAAPGR
jgi:hypothetical protein